MEYELLVEVACLSMLLLAQGQLIGKGHWRLDVESLKAFHFTFCILYLRICCLMAVACMVCILFASCSILCRCL